MLDIKRIRESTEEVRQGLINRDADPSLVDKVLAFDLRRRELLSVSEELKGKKNAVYIIRKHRLWETFLYKKLDFSWDEVHEVAEQLEHIQSPKLIDKLDKFLEFPEFDPHGDPIPDKQGRLKIQNRKTLTDIAVGSKCKMVAVKDNSSSFLQYVVKVGLGINNEIKILSRQEYDSITVIEVNGKRSSVSQKFSENIFVI